MMPFSSALFLLEAAAVGKQASIISSAIAAIDSCNVPWAAIRTLAFILGRAAFISLEIAPID